MADNITLSDLTGSPVASTDEVTTVNGTGSLPAQHVQRMQLATVSGAAATDVSSANPLPVSGNVGLAPQTSGGTSTAKVIAAATNNATSIKGSAGQVFGWYLYNAATSVRYVKLYDKATAPAPATDTPKLTLALPPGAVANVEVTNGIAFANGIGLAIVAGMADTDNTSVAANDVLANILYK